MSGKDRTPSTIIAVLAVLAAAVAFYELSRPGLLFGISADISVYLGAAVRLVHGVLPYRDFVLVQPPGIVLLASPVALLSELIGTRDALAVLRLLTPLLAAANVVLVGKLVRHLGPVSVLIGCGVMAFYPAELFALHNGLLEPLLCLFCLLGARLAFNGDHFAAPRRIVAAGGLFGVACAVKASAIIPALVVVALCLPYRRRLFRFVAGVAVGFLVPTLPFIASAPAAFFRDVVAAQLGRIPVSGRAPLAARLGDLTAASAFGGGKALVIAIAIGLTGFVIAGFVVIRRRVTALEVFALTTTITIAAAQLVPAQYYTQYAAFLAPFLALLLAIATGRLVGERTPRLTLVMAAAVVTALLAGQVSNVSRASARDVVHAVDTVIPAGGCVTSDGPTLLVTTDRFTAAVPGCTNITDPFGTMLAIGDASPSAVATWLDAFAHVDYIVSGVPFDRWYIAPGESLRMYVARNFRPVRSAGLLVYVRNGLPVGRPAS